jgi:O-antigen ligase
MFSRVSRLSFPILLAIGLGYAIDQDGGVVTWGWNTCLLIAGLVSAVYWAVTPASFAAPWGTWPERALFLLPLYVGLQLVPLPLFLLRILSPARARIAENLGAVMPRPEFAAFSVAPSTTEGYLLRLLGYLLVFLFVREITRRTPYEWLGISFLPLVVIGVLEAALGVSQNGDGTEVVGTYVNRNHFAGLLEMILPGTIAYGIGLVREIPFRPPSLLRTLSGCAFFLAATVMFVAVLYSQSKMGFVAALCGPLAMAAIALGASPNPRRKWLGVAGLVAIFLAAFIFLPSDRVINGFVNASDDNTAEGRLPVERDSLRLIADYPVFGTGLGTYGSAFVKYQTENGDVAFTNAHNDYLQLFAELGLLGFALLACWALPVVVHAFRTATRDAELTTRCLALGCVGGMVAIGIHSLADFNLYLPANAMVLVWIAGVAAGLPPLSESQWSIKPSRPTRFLFKPVVLLLSGVLIAYSTGWLVYEFKFQGQPEAERSFCRFGICDIDSVLAAETAAREGNIRPASPSTLREALRRDPSAPGRWFDLGESLNRSGQAEQARLCFAKALALGPNTPPILLGAAQFYQQAGDENQALDLTSRALARTVVYAFPVFDWFEAAKLPVPDILSHLPPDPNIYRAYLRYLESTGEMAGAKLTWNAVVSHGYVDDALAVAYTNWLYGRGEYETAAETWAGYLGGRASGYRKSNWIFNGDFEAEFTESALDWTINPADGIEVARDSDAKHSGQYSLRIRLAGKQNLTSLPVSQRAVVTPGRYRFEAYLKTQDLSTDQGIGLQISDPNGTSHLNVTSPPLLGSNDWRQFSADFCVMPQTKLVAINLVRQQSLKFDNLIKGTLWMDSVSLSKLSPACF